MRLLRHILNWSSQLSPLTTQMTMEYITIQDAAEISGKSIQTIRRAIKSKKLQTRKQKTPQGFNYLIEKGSLGSFYNLKLEEKVHVVNEMPEMKETISASKKEDSFYISNDDFKNFTQTLERMVNQHSDERQNFLRLVNTLQEKIFVLENQLNLLKAPQQKSWLKFWK